MRWASACLLLLYSITSGFAQDGNDSVRQKYIHTFEEYFSAWPVVKKRTLAFQAAQKNDRSNRVNFLPNDSYSIGAGAYVFDVTVELAFAIPIEEKSYFLYGRSDALDVGLNALARAWGADLYYQKYRGFYADDPSIDYTGGQPYPQRRDILTRNFGITGFYIFNRKKFSFQSAFNFSERQVKSSGSFLISGAINSFKLTADSAVLDASYRNEFGEGSAFEDLRYVTVSLMPGYAYHFIYRYFFVNAALMAGPGHNWINYKNQNGSGKNDITFNSLLSLRIGAGYNGKRFFAGIAYMRQWRNVDFGNIYFTNSSTVFRVLAGYRFKEFGVLRKSVWDIPRRIFQGQ